MKRTGRLPAICATVVFTIGVAAAASDAPRVYTGEDLERMFGPAPRGPSDPVDKSRPEDWMFVEQFLDRQYSRIEADRSWDLNRRTLDIAEQRSAPRVSYPYGGVAWGLGYPASTWWQHVYPAYRGHDGWRGTLPLNSREDTSHHRGHRR